MTIKPLNFFNFIITGKTNLNFPVFFLKIEIWDIVPRRGLLSIKDAYTLNISEKMTL